MQYVGVHAPRFLYLRHKNKDALFIENRRCIWVGKEAPAGAPSVAPSLKSTCVMSLRHKHQDSLFSRNIISYFGNTLKFGYGLKSDFWLGFRTENSKTMFSYHQPYSVVRNCLYYHGVIYNSRWVPLAKLLEKVALGKSSENLPT